jgi:hypothetical protein
MLVLYTSDPCLAVPGELAEAKPSIRDRAASVMPRPMPEEAPVTTAHGP